MYIPRVHGYASVPPAKMWQAWLQGVHSSAIWLPPCAVQLAIIATHYKVRMREGSPYWYQPTWPHSGDEPV